jgi:hypothetical protein
MTKKLQRMTILPIPILSQIVAKIHPKKPKNYPAFKNVQIETRLLENGGNLRRTTNCWKKFLDQNLRMPIVEIGFP